MDSNIKDTIRKIQGTTDLVELKSLIVGVRENLGFAHFLYGVRLSNSFSAISHFIISDYPEVWLQEYTTKNYAEFDPVVKHCVTSHEPYCWDRLQLETEPHLVEFAQACASHGLLGGLCIGIHGYSGDVGIFCMGGPTPLASGSDAELEAAGVLNTLLPYVHAAVTRLASFKHAETETPQLSKRELECLLWTAEGKTTEEIAMILFLSAPTVSFHLKNVIGKLRVSNRNQAIAKAVLLGLIKPQYSALSTPRTYLF